MKEARAVAVTVSALIVLGATAVHAQTSSTTTTTPTTTTTTSTTTATTTTKGPVSGGLASVQKNLKDNPDNKGLQNAEQRLLTNQERIEAKRADTATRVEKAQRVDKVERVEKVERVQKAERPERPERASRGR